MTLLQLDSMLRQEFGIPFIRDGLVRSEMQTDGSLKIWIGPRDVHIDAEANVLGAGTAGCWKEMP